MSMSVARKKKCLLALLSFLKRLSTQRRCQKSRKLAFRLSWYNKWLFELEHIFPFLLRSTPYSQRLLFEAYISWRLLHKSWHKKILKERSTSMRSLYPPMKRQLSVQAESHLMCALVFFVSRPKYNRFQPDGFLFLIFLQRPYLTCCLLYTSPSPRD